MNASLAKLGDIADFNPRLPALEGDTRVSFVPMSAVNAETAAVENGDERFYAEVSRSYTPFLKGDILVAKITPCFENNKIAQATVSHSVGFGSTEFHVIRPRIGRADARFILHYLRQEHIRRDGERKMTGSAGQRRVPEHFLSNLQIVLPPLSEQRRIATILDKADDLRAKRRAALDSLSSLARASFADLFGDPVSNPKGWPRRPFGELLEKIDSGWSPVCLDRPVESEEWGMLKLGAITWCEYDPWQNKALLPHVEPDPDLEVKAGDLLFSRKNTYELVAACAFVRVTPPKLMISDLIFRLRLKTAAKLEPCYLHQLLIYPSKRREIQKLAGGSAGSMPNISKARLQAAMIEVPPEALQQELAKRINSVENFKQVQLASLAQMNALFMSLQCRAFRGEL